MFKNIEIDPVAKPRMTQRDRWKLRPCVLKYHQYCDNLKKFKLDVDWENLSVTFHLPMPKSWSQKKRFQNHGNRHQQRPDIDNLLKGFMDALLPEDCRVWNVQVKKLWGITGGIYVKCKDL